MSDFDLMVAAHAVTPNPTRFSRDQAFAQMPMGIQRALRVEVWSPVPANQKLAPEQVQHDVVDSFSKLMALVK